MDPPPVFPINADLSPLPAAPEGVSSKVSIEPGMRGLSPEQRVNGLSYPEWQWALAQLAADNRSTIKVEGMVRVSGEATRLNVAANLVTSHYALTPPPGVSAQEWAPAAEAMRATDWEDASRVRTQLLDIPGLVSRVADAAGFPATLPGHYVAWVSMEGVIEFDIMGQGREGSLWQGVDLVCECSTLYQVRTGGGVTRWAAPGLDEHACPYRQVAANGVARAAGIRLGMTYGQPPTPAALRAALDDALAGRWVGQLSGSQLWGSNLYLDTVARMCGVRMGDMWEVAGEAERLDLVSLEGSVLILPDPTPAIWEPGWVYEGARGRIEVRLPASRKAEGVVQLADPDSGELLQQLRAGYSTDFGVDEDDRILIDEACIQLVG